MSRYVSHQPTQKGIFHLQQVWLKVMLFTSPQKGTLTNPCWLWQAPMKQLNRMSLIQINCLLTKQQARLSFMVCQVRKPSYWIFSQLLPPFVFAAPVNFHGKVKKYRKHPHSIGIEPRFPVGFPVSQSIEAMVGWSSPSPCWGSGDQPKSPQCVRTVTSQWIGFKHPKKRSVCVYI